MKVLIVDDEPQMRRLLQTTLAGREYVVEAAANAKEALDLAAMWRPDVIVLDLGLPDLDGLEVVRRIRDWSRLPIIVVSARDEERAKVAALDLGAPPLKAFVLGLIVGAAPQEGFEPKCIHPTEPPHA
mgnify:CR=1 FL=1